MSVADVILLACIACVVCFFSGGYLMLHLSKDLLKDMEQEVKEARDRADRAMDHRMEMDTRMDELEAKGLLKVERVIDVVRRRKK